MFFRSNKIIFLNIKFCQQDFIVGKEKNKYKYTHRVGRIAVNIFSFLESIFTSPMLIMLFPDY